jgi:hypothetical protein
MKFEGIYHNVAQQALVAVFRVDGMVIPSNLAAINLVETRAQDGFMGMSPDAGLAEQAGKIGRALQEAQSLVASGKKKLTDYPDLEEKLRSELALRRPEFSGAAL